MLEHIEIRNFQSLKHVSLDLHPLTVIVGQSSSGKSAFFRALRTLTSNQRGNAFISTGEKLCTISATLDRGKVVLTRGKGTNDNKYTVIPSHSQAEQRAYAKLGGETPPEVSQFLGIPSKDPINYASQFDKPYLLADSPADVARTLGALTNVNVIFEAAREANRRKLSQSSTLRTRQNDIALIREKAETYRPLKAQRTALEEAEALIEKAHALQAEINLLDSLISAIQTAESTLTRIQPFLDLSVPDEAPILKAAEKLKDFEQSWEEIVSYARQKKTAGIKIQHAEDEVTSLEKTYLEKLTQAGTCPTCGQTTTHIEKVDA